MTTGTPEPNNLQEILDLQRLIRPGIRLPTGQQAMRVMLFVPTSLVWMQQNLPSLERDGYKKGEITPKEQATQLIRGFVAGESFEPPLPHDMNDTGAGIWELRTDDLRFFGWFPRRGMFCVSGVETKKNCLTSSLYNGMKTQAMHHRTTINLYGGVYLTGDLDGLL